MDPGAHSKPEAPEVRKGQGDVQLERAEFFQLPCELLPFRGARRRVRRHTLPFAFFQKGRESQRVHQSANQRQPIIH